MRFSWILLGLLIVGISVCQARAGEPAAASDVPKTPAAQPDDVEKTIRAGAEAFVEAFDRGDAKAIADTWTPDGEYVDEQGRKFQGRAAIQKQYTDFFAANPGLKITINVQSVRLLAVGTAVEEGDATVVSDRVGPLASSHYTAVHVKQDGRWLAASVRETDAQPLSNYPRLADLEWLIGDWTAEHDGTTIRTSFRWTDNRQFLARTFSASEGDTVTLTGLQVIGWDPIAGSVASWIFDSDGGHGSGTWTRRPGGWSIESHGVLRDGTRTTATYLFTRIDDNSLAWQSIHRKAGDVDLPDAEQIVLKRVVEAKQSGEEKPAGVIEQPEKAPQSEPGKASPAKTPDNAQPQGK